MKKHITILTAIALCASSVAVGAAASNAIREIKAQIRPDFTIKIDGKVTKFKSADGEVVYPILYDGTTYLPLRAIGNLMGKTVYWTEDSKLIELKETTVTDADVIIGNADEKTDIVVKNDKKPDKPEKPDKPTVEKPKADIELSKAKGIALKKAGLAADGVIFEKEEIDYDDGILQYEFEFRKDGIEYEVDVSATTGEILSFEKDID